MRSLYDQGARNLQAPVLVVAASLRPALAKLFAAALNRMAVMSVIEIGKQVQLERIGVVGNVSTVSAAAGL